MRISLIVVLVSLTEKKLMTTRNRSLLPLAVVAMVIVGLAANVNAAIIAEYEFTSGSASSTGPLGSNIGFKDGIVDVDAAAFTSDRLEIQGVDTAGGALGGTVYTDPDAGRIATENWVTFTITVPSTQQINLTTLDFDYTEIEPASFLLGVYTSKTGFTEGDHLLGLYRAGTPGGTVTTNNGTSVDLSGAAFQNLSGETVEFRFLLGDDSGATSRIHVLDNIELVGDITPDPATMSLLALGGLGLLRRRRNRA